MFLNAVFDPVLDAFRTAGVSRVVRGDWHDHQLAAGVMPVKRVVGAVIKMLGVDNRNIVNDVMFLAVTKL